MTFDLEKARDLAANPIHCPETDEVFRKAMAEIERLRGEMEKRDIRISELERALCLRDQLAHSAIGQIAWSISIETGRMPDEMCIDFLEWQVPPEIKKTWTDWAAKQLRAEGKIGPDAKPRSWQITEERKAAIWHAVAVLKENDPDDEHLWDEEIAVLRAMLKEAE